MEEESRKTQDGLLRRTYGRITSWGDAITGRRLLNVTYAVIALVAIAGVLTVISMFR